MLSLVRDLLFPSLPGIMKYLSNHPLRINFLTLRLFPVKQYMQPKALKLTKQLLCGCCLSKSSESVADAAEVAAPEGSVQESIRTLDDDELEYIINQSYCSSTGSARDSAVTDRSRVPDGSVAASPSSFSVTVFSDIY